MLRRYVKTMMGAGAAAALAAALLLAAGGASAARADPVLAAAGDIACAPGSTVDSDHCQQSATATLIGKNAPAAVATLGDEQYQSGTYSEFTGAGSFHDTWGAFESLIHPAPGNHEYATSGAGGYFKYFDQAAGPPTQTGYYSYDLGAWHLLSLNSNCSDSSPGCASYEAGAVTSAEVAWVQADLAANAGRCTLAYWHHPLFSTTQNPAGSPGVKPLWDALYEHHADIVLNGHAHDYERFAAQDPTGIATTAGIAEFVVGTGGDSHDVFTGPPSATSQLRDATDFGALLLTLHPHSYDWTFESTPKGTTVDSGTARCNNQPPLVTTVPAAPVGRTSATLSGSADPQGEPTTYHFDYGTAAAYGQRSPSSEPALGAADRSAHPVSTALTDLTPSTTYHFRITASNASGTSYGADQTFTTQPPPAANHPLPGASLQLAGKTGRRALMRHGLRIRITCPAACSIRAKLELASKRHRRRVHLALGHLTRHLAHPGSATLVIRLTGQGRRWLSHAPRTGSLELVADIASAQRPPQVLRRAIAVQRAARALSSIFEAPLASWPALLPSP